VLLVGIDPGLDGGIAVLGLPFGPRTQEEAWAYPMPTVPHFSGKGREVNPREVQRLLTMHRRCVPPQSNNPHDDPAIEQILVAVEHVENRPRKGEDGAFVKMGASSMFNFGDGFGMVRAAVILAGCSLVYARPQVWQKVVFAGMKKDNAKKTALSFASRRFPGVRLQKSDKAVKPHEGIVDALCIAEYLRRVNNGTL
jgi:hypothetical protein